MAEFNDFFFGSRFAVWEEAIAEIFQGIEDQREATLNAVYLSTALMSELSDRYGVLVGSKPDPSWQVEVFREHLQEVMQAYLMMSSSREGIQQVVAATTQMPPILRPIQLLQRWLLGFQYLPNRYFRDLDGFVVAEFDGPYMVTTENNLLILKINGVSQTLFLPTGEAVTVGEIINSINSQAIGAVAFPFGKRFGLETIERDPGGSVQIEEPSTADTLFGFDNFVHNNSSPPPSGTGTLPFGWRVSGDYLAVPTEAAPPTGTDSQPVSYEGSLFGIAPVQVRGAIRSPFVGLLSPLFLTNGGFESGFTEWNRTAGPEFFISTTKSRSGSKSLAVVTKTKTIVNTDGTKDIVPVINSIETNKKFIPEGCTVFVESFHQAATTGSIYSSPSTPPSAFQWLLSNGVFGYVDQQFAQDPVVTDPDVPTVVLTDTSVDFIAKKIKPGMAVHVANGGNIFDGIIRGVETHRLLIDQWRNGPMGGPTAAYIRSAAPAGSSVTYTNASLKDPAKNFTALGVQTGADYRTRDKVRVDETISHFGQITTERQIVRDVAAISTGTNPNDTLQTAGGWGASPTPISATVSVSGNPYTVYIRPPDGTSYTIFHSLNEIPDFSPDFASISANFLYEVKFYAFDGSFLNSVQHQFRPIPGSNYERAAFDIIVPKGAETAQLVITVGPDERISEPVQVAFDAPVVLTQVFMDGDSLVRSRDGAVLVRGGPVIGDYAVNSDGTVLFFEGGPSRLLPTDTIQLDYNFLPQGGALTSIDDITFRCLEEDLRTAFHVAVDQKMQKVVFDTGLVPAQGTITYSAVPADADTITIGSETYEFDTGSFDGGVITYSGFPNDGDTLQIGGVIFEFDSDCNVATGHVQTFIDVSPDTTFTNLVSAIDGFSSVVRAVIDTAANTVTIKAVNPGISNPAIIFTKSGVNFVLSPLGGTLTGGAVPSIGVGNIAVPVLALDDTFLALVEQINTRSTSVYAVIDTTANVVTVKALNFGFAGNDIAFSAVVPDTAYVLSPAVGHLNGATDLHAGAQIIYTGQPNDGDTLTVGTVVYEFDNDGIVVGTNQAIPIGPTADSTWSVLAGFVTGDGFATTTFQIGRVIFAAVAPGTAGNAVVFIEAAANATAFPSGGTFQDGVDAGFVDINAPTCAEVVAFLNPRLVGVTASCDPPDLGDPNNGFLVLTSNTAGFHSAVVVGHGSANTALGFVNDRGRRNGENEVQPGWRITSGTPGSQLVAISRAVHPINNFFGTDWHARMWVRSSNPAVKAHVLMFFEDENGNMLPSIGGNDATGTISSVGTAVTGVATLFTTELVVGSLILANQQLRRVTVITDDLHLTTDVAFSPTLAAAEFTSQNPVTLSTTPQVVETTAHDYGRFENADVKLLLNGVANGNTIDIAFPLLVNEISKSLHLSDNTIPRNKQREHKLYRMAVASPDEFTDIEAGLVGSNKRVDEEITALTGTDFTALQNQNVFPNSETVERIGISATGSIQYTGQPSDGDTITIATNTYEFDNNAIVAAGHLSVTIGADADATFANLVTKIGQTSAFVAAVQNAPKKSVTITALLAGANGNAIVFAPNAAVVRLLPIIGTLDGGIDGETYQRGVDYDFRYEQGEIARLANGNIPDPAPADLAISYSFFPGDVALNDSYSQTIKPLGVKLEIDPTCLFFFRGRLLDFTHPATTNVNFDVIERTPSRFTYLKPTARGRHAQVVHFSASVPHAAPVDFTAKQDQGGLLIKTKDGISRAIPQDTTNGWFFFSGDEIRLATGTAYLASGEGALFDADAEYEFVYYVMFQFVTAPITIADLSTGYVLLPYSYKVRQVNESKEDVDQVILLNTATRRATLNLPAVEDQSLAEMSRTLGGVTEIISDELWGFVDDVTVEVFLGGFDEAAVYRLTYKSSKVHFSTPVSEMFEVSTSSDGITFTPYAEFVPGDVRTLNTFVKFRATVWGDFGVEDYRLRGFGGIVDDATINIGGFGISPFGRFPFGDGGVCLADTEAALAGELHLSGTLTPSLLFHPVQLSGGLGLSGALGANVTPPVGGGGNATFEFSTFDSAGNPGDQFVGFDSALGGTPASVQTAFPVATTITKITARILSAPGLGNAEIFKINVNGVDSGGIVLTIVDGNTMGTATGTITINPGDLLCLSISTTGAPIGDVAFFTVEYTV